jgi:predicted O-methyltransferase YrrM
MQRADEVLRSMRTQQRDFDIVFIDADKKYYKQYLEYVLGDDVDDVDDDDDDDDDRAMNTDQGRTSSKRPLIRKGGVIVIDNTLWKGLVLNEVEHLAAQAPDPSEFGKAARMTSVAQHMHGLNDFAVKHPALDPVMLPIRDGLTIMRYRGASADGQEEI